MATDAEIGRAFRRYLAGLDRSPGSTAPESLGNQATPTLDTLQGEVSGRVDAGRSSTYADRDDTGAAHRNSPNFYGWTRQHGAEHQGMRESFLDLGKANAGDTVTLNPNLASNFFVRTSGDVTLALAPFEAAAPQVPATAYLSGVKLWVARTVGGNIVWPSGLLWDASVLDPDGDGKQTDSLLGPAKVAAWDVFTLVLVPGIGTFGFYAMRQATGVSS